MKSGFVTNSPGQTTHSLCGWPAPPPTVANNDPAGVDADAHLKLGGAMGFDRTLTRVEIPGDPNGM
jgi:hypothetical protein